MGKREDLAILTVDTLSRKEYMQLVLQRDLAEKGEETKKGKDWYWEEVVEGEGTDFERVVGVRKALKVGAMDKRALTDIAKERQQEREAIACAQRRRNIDDEVSDLVRSDKAKYERLPNKISELVEDGRDLEILLAAVRWVRLKNPLRWDMMLMSAITEMENNKLNAEMEEKTREKQRVVFKTKQEEWKRESFRYLGQVERGEKPKLDLMEMAGFARDLIRNGYSKKADFPLNEFIASDEQDVA